MSNDPSASPGVEPGATSPSPDGAHTGSGLGAADGEALTRIGRDPDNDIVLSDLQVSRHHARLRRTADSWSVIDLGSRNGTFVNGRQVRKATLVHAGDIISIGHHELLFDGVRLHDHLDTGPASLVADDLTVQIGDKVILDDISFALREGSLLGLIGPSGCGKSTLLRAVTGLRPANQGKIWYDGRDLYAEYAKLRFRIGMVPQDDVLHRQLKVRAALRYAAALRFADDVPRKERWAKVDEVMASMRLTERAKARIDTLSGGQRKRASVAMELLTEPALLCLDEPTSGLDPALDRDVMRELKELADKGKTVVVVTHSVLHLDYCDRVLVLGYGGTMAYFGPPGELLSFFGASDYADVFEKVTEEPARWSRAFRNSPLYTRYVTAPAPNPQSTRRRPPGRQYQAASTVAEAAGAEAAGAEAPDVDAAGADSAEPMPDQTAAGESPAAASSQPLVPTQRTDEPTMSPTPPTRSTPVASASEGPAAELDDAIPDPPPSPKVAPGKAPIGRRSFTLFARNPSAPLRQYWTLCTRMIRVIVADRGFALFLLAMPFILALLSHTVPGEFGLGRPDRLISLEAQQLLVVLVTGAAFLGTAAAVREIVAESAIYRRERAAGVSPAAYLASKVTVLLFVNTIQVAIFVDLALLGRGAPEESLVVGSQTVEVIIPMAAIALVSTLLGLLISALVKTTEQTTPALVVSVMAQLVFSGGLFLLAGQQVMEIIAWLMPTRWGFAAAAATTDLGSMLPASFHDPVWAHTADNWWRSIMFMTVQAVVLIVITRLALRRHEPGRA